MNLDFIRCFEVLAETLSFSAAAERLNLAQSNVSRQIQLLEKEVGAQLFQRTRHGVSLTSEGQRFREQVLPPCLFFRESIAKFTRSEQEEVGEIKFGCFGEVGKTFFMPLCLEFQKLYPRVTIEMTYESESTIFSMINHSRIEFGIVSHPPIIEGLAAYPVLSQKISLFGPNRDGTPAREEIEKAPFIAYEKSDVLLSELWLRKISKRKKPNVVTVVNSHDSMMTAIETLGAYAVLPAGSAKERVREGRIKPISGYGFEVPLFLVHPAGTFMSKKNKTFKQFVLQRSRETGET
ncbi:MAG: LysR family transcriptional regulator [Cryobacterium sp.]|nr:LysR family transcriptional regulator [Oligoflexia bacterium]